MNWIYRVSQIHWCTKRFQHGSLFLNCLLLLLLRGLNDKVAFIQIEELAPFPFDALEEVLSLYPSAVHFAWLQEEPRNRGAWNHVRSRIEKVLSARKSLASSKGIELRYLGREESALPAPGIGKLHQKQQRSVLESAFWIWKEIRKYSFIKRGW